MRSLLNEVVGKRLVTGHVLTHIGTFARASDEKDGMPARSPQSSGSNFDVNPTVAGGNPTQQIPCLLSPPCTAGRMWTDPSSLTTCPKTAVFGHVATTEPEGRKWTRVARCVDWLGGLRLFFFLMSRRSWICEYSGTLVRSRLPAGDESSHGSVFTFREGQGVCAGMAGLWCATTRKASSH